MKKGMLAIVAIAATQSVVVAADLSYVPQGEGPYLWSDAAAWGGAVPTGEDTVRLYGDYAPENPLTITDAATVGGIQFGDDNLTKRGDRFFLDVVSGGSLTIGTLLSANQWGVKAATNIINIAEGASLESQGFDRFGCDDGSAVVITNRGTMTLTDMYLGYANRTVATLDNFGDLTVSREFVLGRGVNTADCVGSLRLRPGSTFSKTVSSKSGSYTFSYVGRGGKGELIVENTMQLPGSDQLFIGYRGEGSVVVQGGGVITNANNLRVELGTSDNTVGRLTLKDNAYVNTDYYNKDGVTRCVNIARGAGSKGYLTMSGTSFIKTKSSGQLIASGDGSYAELDLSDSAVLYSASAVEVATGEASSALIKLSGSAALQPSSHIHLGSGLSSTVSVEVAGSASVVNSHYAPRLGQGLGSVVTVRMKGGSFCLRPYSTYDAEDTYDYNISRFGIAGSRTEFRGYGAFPTHTNQPSKDGKRCRVELRGRIVADGEGEDRDLTPVCMTIFNPADEANANGDSGWYAENHGRLIMPHTDPLSGGAITIGDRRDRVDPALVNSLRVTVKGAADPDAGYVKVAMYAPDRTDLPAALPMEKGDSVLGIWRMGYVALNAKVYDEYSTTAKGTWIDFTSADVKIRHANDFGRKTKITRIIAYRYDPTAGNWVKLSDADLDPANPYYTFKDVPADSGKNIDRYTLGWVALVARQQSGLAIIVR